MVGGKGKFSVKATGGLPLSYQWQKNAVPIAGATKALYTTPAAMKTDNGALYSVVVSNSSGSVTSNSAKLIVKGGAEPSLVENR